MSLFPNRQALVQTLGPGIVFASTCIGVSHLVQSTRAGADYGFALLWAVLLFLLGLRHPPVFDEERPLGAPRLALALLAAALFALTFMPVPLSEIELAAMP